MAINFAAASTAGLNNPGTEIITLVKDGSGNFINPPSYDKMRAYLRSGDMPMLFITDEAGETGDIYQFSGYSETENKIRFIGDTNAIEFCAGCETPSIVETAVGADVVKGHYKLRVGEQKFTGYGFAILYNDSVVMNYADTGIYDESSGSKLNMSRQSIFKANNTSKKKIVITVGADSDTKENEIRLYRSNGKSTSISADGYLLSSDDVLKVGSNQTFKKIIRYVNTPEEEYDAATKGYVDGKISDTEIFLQSSTAGSTKKFRITVDDSGTISATEVT